MDKLILVHYIDIKGASRHQAREMYNNYIHVVVARSREEYPDILHFIVPTVTHGSRIDCINPKLVGTSEYRTVVEILNKVQIDVDNFIKQNQEPQESGDQTLAKNGKKAEDEIN